MNSTFSTQTLLRTLLATTLAASGCAKSGQEDKAPSDPTAKAAPMGPKPSDVIARVGVQPGAVVQQDGPAAVLKDASGTIEVRALGEEAFRASAPNQPLYAGDQVRAGEGARAIVLFPDDSTAELAELTTLQIGSRTITQDPASTVAVLSGVARFGVTPRLPAEGPFMVFTPAGLVATKGTVFGVGVAADGDARVGVEEGVVEVAGATAFDAPAQLEADHAIELAAAGTLGAPTAWSEDDWGSWRDSADAKLDVNATVAAHGAAMADLSAQLDATYASLEGLASDLARFEAQAAAAAQANASADYEAKLAPAEVTIDASYLAALQLAYLTHAHAAHAELAAELYMRQPELAAWAKVEPQVHAAVLWPKRLDLTSALYFEPLRMQYYVHHARGRARAELVGVMVPEFYAQVTPPVVPIAEARGKLKIKGYVAPELVAVASARPLWVLSPKAEWQANAKVRAVKPRTKLGFWVRPPKLQSTAMLGAKVRGEIAPLFAVAAPKLRAECNLKGQAKLTLGHEIHVAPPNLRAAAKARAGFRGEYAMPGLLLEAHGPKVEAGAHLKGAAAFKAKSGAKASAKAKIEAEKRARAKLEAGAKAKGAALAGARAQAGAGVRASAKVQVAAPKVEVKLPKASASAKGSAKLQIGH